MEYGYIKTAAITPRVRVADTAFNVGAICEDIGRAVEQQAKILVFPELSITGYTCGDLFLQDTLLRKAKEGLFRIREFSENMDCLIFVGLPLEHEGSLYNCAAAVSRGEILGIVPKMYVPNYAEFYELRHFMPGVPGVGRCRLSEDCAVPFGTSLLFRCRTMERLTVGAEICEDVWAPLSPSVSHALAGATVIVNLSASDETIGKARYRNSLICGQSAKLVCGYIYANAGEGESTTDLVFGGHNIIAENGKVVSESHRFENGILYGELDLEKICGERRRMNTYPATGPGSHYEVAEFGLNVETTRLSRQFKQTPFVPDRWEERSKRCEEILSIQSAGLKKRLVHTNCQRAVVGISGGLDSTLALLVACRSFDLAGLPREHITAVTMPCFGTTDRTYNNAVSLVRKLGAALREINIRESVLRHFADIGQDAGNHDVTYENAQARERTQILMDIANQEQALVIGTGDLSELALGWATYNGDHMSMYGVNASVPKTLVRHLVQYCADTCGDGRLSAVLQDILDTPVSPELLPPKDGVIAQKTEDIVGPYELHDFYLYYIVRYGFEPGKIYHIATLAFAGVYDKETILKWLKVFYRRFFSQQFKRSCLPDGPKVGTVALSPRGDWRMPSDACVGIWMEQLEKL